MDRIIVLRLTHYGVENSVWYEKNEGEKRGNNGIGNMLFQIAAAKSYCLDNNLSLYVPDIEIWAKKECLDKNTTIFRNCNTNDWFPSGLPIIRIDGSNDPFPKVENSQVLGYFECKDNFYKNIEFIQEQFKPWQHDIEKILSKYPYIRDDNLCSIHIRRGKDYLQIFGEKFMKDLDEYYLRAIKYMIKNKNIRNFIVFSNDIEYSKKLLSSIEGINLNYSNERDYEEIWMMSLVKNNIVSHSTFSIWGAYLNKNPGAFIICPEIRRNFYSLPNWHIM